MYEHVFSRLYVFKCLYVYFLTGVRYPGDGSVYLHSEGYVSIQTPNPKLQSRTPKPTPQATNPWSGSTRQLPGKVAILDF